LLALDQMREDLETNLFDIHPFSVMPSAIAARSDDQAIIIERQGVAPTMISERVFEKTSCRPAWVVFRFNDLYLDFETA
jgi:hypothetical protein